MNTVQIEGTQLLHKKQKPSLYSLATQSIILIVKAILASAVVYFTPVLTAQNEMDAGHRIERKWIEHEEYNYFQFKHYYNDHYLHTYEGWFSAETGELDTFKSYYWNKNNQEISFKREKFGGSESLNILFHFTEYPPSIEILDLNNDGIYDQLIYQSEPYYWDERYRAYFHLLAYPEIENETIPPVLKADYKYLLISANHFGAERIKRKAKQWPMPSQSYVSYLRIYQHSEASRIFEDIFNKALYTGKAFALLYFYYNDMSKYQELVGLLDEKYPILGAHYQTKEEFINNLKDDRMELLGIGDIKGLHEKHLWPSERKNIMQMDPFLDLKSRPIPDELFINPKDKE